MNESAIRRVISDLAQAFPDLELNFEGVESVRVINLSGAVLELDGIRFLPGEKRSVPNFFMGRYPWNEAIGKRIISIASK